MEDVLRHRACNKFMGGEFVLTSLEDLFNKVRSSGLKILLLLVFFSGLPVRAHDFSIRNGLVHERVIATEWFGWLLATDRYLVARQIRQRQGERIIWTLRMCSTSNAQCRQLGQFSFNQDLEEALKKALVQWNHRLKAETEVANHFRVSLSRSEMQKTVANLSHLLMELEDLPDFNHWWGGRLSTEVFGRRQFDEFVDLLLTIENGHEISPQNPEQNGPSTPNPLVDEDYRLTQYFPPQ